MATIVAVHGTFASGPDAGEKWWQRGSVFERDLMRFVQGADGRLEVERLVWDGQNSENSRRHAGAELKGRLSTLEQRGERYCLIGHSHGGSVILAALLQSAHAGMALPGLSRWITVGTPFISFARRSLVFSRLPLVGKAMYVSLLTFLGVLSIAIGLSAVPTISYFAVSIVCMPVWLCAHLTMGWIADRRLARSGAGLFEVSNGSLLLPQLGLLARLLYALVFSVGFVHLLWTWFFNTVFLTTNTRKLLTTVWILAFLVGFHLGMAWISRRWRSRRARGSKSSRALLSTSIDRWLALRHPQDEAIEGLSHLHTVSFPIFRRDFVVAPVTFASVMALPLVVMLMVLSPTLIISWPGRSDYREAHYLATNAAFLLMEPSFRMLESIDLVFGSSSPETLAPLAMTLGAVLFFLCSLLLVAGARLLATGISRFASRLLDGAAWRQIRASAFGNDTLGETSCFASKAPGVAGGDVPVLPASLALEISEVSDSAAAKAVSKLRASLNRLAFADDRRTRSDLVSEYLTWDELIHTAYFNVPRFNKLVAYAVAQSPGFEPTALFLADPDYPVVGAWHDELARR